jgi:hypothetical protein
MYDFSSRRKQLIIYSAFILAAAFLISAFVGLNNSGFCFSQMRYVGNKEIYDIGSRYAFDTYVFPRQSALKKQVLNAYQGPADLLKHNSHCCEVLSKWGGRAYDLTSEKPQFSQWDKIWQAGKIRWVLVEFEDPALDPNYWPKPADIFIITAHDNCGKIFNNWNGD